MRSVPNIPQMQHTNSPQIIQFPVSKDNASEPVQQLLAEIFQLRQTVDELTNTAVAQKELIQQLRDEIAILKGQKPKPQIPPSKLEGPGSKPDWRKQIGPHDYRGKPIRFSLWATGFTFFGVPSFHGFPSVTLGLPTSQERTLEITRLARQVIKKIRRAGKPGQPRGKTRTKKKAVLQIHEKPVIHPQNVPKDAIFKGYTYYTVQDIILQPHNVQYQLARYELSDGSYIKGQLPGDIHGHYGPQLVAWILHQYYACRVTEPLLLEQLRAFGILISAGQLNNILIENKDALIREVAELLPVAANLENQIQVDDTGGRHKGQNQYTTIIGNRWFSVFTTTDTKNRINFLKLLQDGKEEYVINEDTVEYLSHVNVPDYLPGYVFLSQDSKFTTREEWEKFLAERNIIREAEVRFVTEAALYASVLQKGIPRNLGVHGDDAGQFDAFVRSLCWIHEERHYRKLIMTTDESRMDLERVRSQIWDLYQALKMYKKSPTADAAAAIREQFDAIFQQKTSSPTLDRQLAKTLEKKEELLRVLQRPETPLHNNSSETCARAAKIKFKVSGGTRSEAGQKARDTFLSLKQTCRKLGINFFVFLLDRVRRQYAIPRLATIICERALAAAKDLPNPLLPMSGSNEVALQLDRRLHAG
jgi:Transposase IS66 family